MPGEDEILKCRRRCQGKAAGLLFTLLLAVVSGVRALEPDPFEAVLAQLKANPPKALEEMPKEQFQLLRQIFTEYTTRLPNFRIMKSAIPALFDRNIAQAMITVAQLCKGKAAGFVLDLFGKPASALPGNTQGAGILCFRVSTNGFLQIELRDQVVVSSCYGDCYPGSMQHAGKWAVQSAIRPGRWELDFRLYENSVSEITHKVTQGKCTSLKDLSEDEVNVLRLAYGLYFGAIRSDGATDPNVWSQEMAKSFSSVLVLCKGQDESSLMDFLGKPTAVWFLAPRRLALTYRFAEKRQAGLHFDDDFRLKEIVFGDVSEKK
jgi:hypothetical protein